MVSLTRSTAKSWRKHSFSIEKDVLVVHTSGNRGGEKVDEHAIAMWKEIEAECQKHALHKVMIVSDVEGRLSPSDSSKVVDFLSKLDIQPHLKLSMVDLSFGSYLDNLLSEKIAYEKGVFGKVFHDEAKGREWIGL